MPVLAPSRGALLLMRLIWDGHLGARPQFRGRRRLEDLRPDLFVGRVPFEVSDSLSAVSTIGGNEPKREFPRASSASRHRPGGPVQLFT
jgi:hypothetical protein